MIERVRDFYSRCVEDEWTRLERHPLEFELTQRHIAPFLKPASDILDQGGGPGRYAFLYAAAGHAVTLVDLTPANVEFARAKQEVTGVRLRGCYAGDARSLPFLDAASFDLVLCMGPLYHLADPHDRAAVISECIRLARPGGILVFSYISRMAQCLCILKYFPEEIAAWCKALRHGIATGRNDASFDTGFTEACFTDPREVRPELERAGLEVVKVAGAEGFGCLREDSLKELRQRDAEAYRLWVELAYETSEDPTILGANEHILAIARRPLA